MFLRFAAIVTICLALITLVSCEQSHKKVKLRFKYEAGDSSTHRTSQKMSIKVTEEDSLIEQASMSMNFTIKDDVKRIVDDSVAEVYETIAWEYESVIKNDSVINDTTTDSREMVFYLAPSGKIMDMEFIGEMPEASIEYLKEYYKQYAPVFPSVDVTPGYTWTQTYKVMLEEEPVEASTTYEVKSFVREKGYDCAVIAFDGNIIIPVMVEDKDGNKSKTGVDRINVDGVMYFGYKDGILVSSRDTFTIDRQRKVVSKEKGITQNLKVFIDGEATTTLISYTH